MLHTILLVFAFVFACIAAFFITGWSWRGQQAGYPGWGIHFGWLALAFYLLAILLGAPGLVR